MVVFKHRGKSNYLGTFDTVDEAGHTAQLFRQEHPKQMARKWLPGEAI